MWDSGTAIGAKPGLGVASGGFRDLPQRPQDVVVYVPVADFHPQSVGCITPLRFTSCQRYSVLLWQLFPTEIPRAEFGPGVKAWRPHELPAICPKTNSAAAPLATGSGPPSPKRCRPPSSAAWVPLPTNGAQGRGKCLWNGSGQACEFPFFSGEMPVQTAVENHRVVVDNTGLSTPLVNRCTGSLDACCEPFFRWTKTLLRSSLRTSTACPDEAPTVALTLGFA